VELLTHRQDFVQALLKVLCADAGGNSFVASRLSRRRSSVFGAMPLCADVAAATSSLFHACY
jgi:hypothetical protein